MRNISLSNASIVFTASLAAVLALAQEAELVSTESGTVWVDSEGDWMPLPDIFPAGGQMKVMHGDPATGAADLYFRFPAGYGVPWHFHTPVEKVFIDRGTMEFVMRNGQRTQETAVSEGGYIYFPSRSPHEATCTSSEDCFFYLSSNDVFDIHLVDPENWTATRSWTAGQ